MARHKRTKPTVKRTTLATPPTTTRLDRAKKAVEALTPREFSRLLKWLNIAEDDEWDRQMKQDAAAGRFDVFREEIRRHRRAGTLREMPF